MQTSSPALILRCVHDMAAPGDAELLDRFARSRDEEAFAALLRRHGPMVWRVCRRVLTHLGDAEDAFQATFLRLARHAGSIRSRESVAGWLYSVAGNAARKVRDAAIRRSRVERLAPKRAEDSSDAGARELLDALDQELSRLPETLRAPLVLCHLEGASREEAARQIGCPLGTLKGRLERGKDLLRAALERRGLSLSALLAAAVAGRADVVPPTLARSTLNAALLAGPARGLALVKIAVGLLALGLAVAGVGSPAAPKAAPPPEARPQVKADLFGDPLPEGALLRLGTVRQRHADGTSRAAFLADGKTVAVGDMRGNLIYWDIATGKELQRVNADRSNITALALTPDGKRLALGGWSVVRFLDAATGAAGKTWKVANDSVTRIEFAPDGKTAALLFQGKTIELWDVEAGKRQHALEGHKGNVFAISFAPDGKSLASGSWTDPNVRIWDVASGKQLRAFELKHDVLGVAFSPDGKELAVCGNSIRLRFHDPATGKLLRESKAGHGITDLVYLPSGKVVLSRSGGQLRAWDAATGNLLRESKGNRHSAHLAVSRDGKRLATSWGGPHTFDLWDAATLEPLRPASGHRNRVNCLAFAADGRTLFSGDGVTGDKLTEWGLATGKVIRTVGKEVNGANDLALSPDRRLVASCDGHNSVGLYELATGKEVRRFKGHTSTIVSASFSGDGKSLATGSYYDKSLRLWDVATGAEKFKVALDQSWPCHAVLSPDGKVVAAGGFADGAVKVWDAATGKEVRSLPTAARQLVYSVAISPDGRTLAAGSDGAVKLWELATGRPLREIAAAAPRLVVRVAFSPDGKTLAVGGDDCAVTLWDVNNGSRRAKLAGHFGPTHALAFSADGRRLASGGDDTTILVWDLAKLNPVEPLSAAKLDGLWADLAGDASKAYPAVQILSSAPRESVPLVRKRLPPAAAPSAETRAEYSRLLTALDGDDFAARQKAEAGLEKLGAAAEPLARATLKGQPSLEVRRRLEKFLRALERDDSSDWTRALRALDVLEYAAKPEARRLLADLAAGDAESRLTRMAKAALLRSNSRP